MCYLFMSSTKRVNQNHQPQGGRKPGTIKTAAINTPPKISMSPKKRANLKRKFIFQPSIFSEGYVSVRGSSNSLNLNRFRIISPSPQPPQLHILTGRSCKKTSHLMVMEEIPQHLGYAIKYLSTDAGFQISTVWRDLGSPFLTSAWQSQNSLI